MKQEAAAAARLVLGAQGAQERHRDALGKAAEAGLLRGEDAVDDHDTAAGEGCRRRRRFKCCGERGSQQEKAMKRALRARVRRSTVVDPRLLSASLRLQPLMSGAARPAGASGFACSDGVEGEGSGSSLE